MPSAQMLSDPRHQNEPFPFFRCDHAFGSEACAGFEQLFGAGAAWQARDDSFYSCFLREVTAELPAELLLDAATRMRAITGLPLTDQVVVSAQRMEPGQVVGVHSDRPLLGYEAARVVLQLNRGWQREHGGLLELYDSPEGPPVAEVEPVYDAAFGFVLHEGSYHGVARVNRTRRSLVFNFWHAANTPELADAVTALFADLHFSELPAALDPVATEAESRLPEDVTFRASLTALALHRWGYDAAAVVSGYRFGAGSSPDAADAAGERAAAVRLADWVARLKTGSFDLEQWQELRRNLAGTPPPPRLLPLWNLCLPADRVRG